MKAITRYLLPAAGLAVALPAAHAGDANNRELRVLAAADEPAPHRRVIRVGIDQEKESVTFLGVVTMPAGGALAEQLNLPNGTGLVVSEVSEESPASAVLKRNDVLTKLDDQVLVEQRQLSVLVRNHREGDEVTLTYVRNGKEATAKVKLAKHDVPKMAWNEAGGGMHSFMIPSGQDEFYINGRADMDRVLALIDQTPGFQHHVRINGQPGQPGVPGMRSTTVSTSNSNMVFSDDQGSLDLTIKDGKKTLVAKNAKGDQVFAGPVTTPQERKAMPKEVRDRLDKLEGMQDFSFQTDDNFQGGNVQVVTPGKSKISAPSDATNPNVSQSAGHF